MRKLILLAGLLAVLALSVGCSGSDLTVDTDNLTDCWMGCLDQLVPVVTSSGDTLWVRPSDYTHLVLKDSKWE